MKKVVAFLLFVFTIIFLFFVPAYAHAEIKDDSLEEKISEELFSSIDKEVLSALEDLGITEKNYLEITNYSLNKISDYFSVTLKEKAEKTSKNIFMLLCVIMLCGAISTLFVGSKNESFISYMSTIILILLSVNIIADVLSATISVLKVSGTFMLSYIPIYTLIITLSGNAASALTYNSFLIVFAEVISLAISHLLPDIIGVIFCLIISFSLNEGINITRLTNAVNKTVSIFLGVVAGVFTGFLSIKNILSVSVDSVSVKSIRFLISSLIPIIGSSISDAYSSIIGSINLIKGSVAIVGIFVILIINIPVLVETLIYYLSFTAMSYLSDSFSGVRVGETLRGIACAVRILMLLCVFEMFILIISTGIMLSLKGTV